MIEQNFNYYEPEDIYQSISVENRLFVLTLYAYIQNN